MATEYRPRLKLPFDSIDHGHPDMLLLTQAQTLVAVGFVRVVIGDRGPYMELNDEQLVAETFHWVRAGAYYTEYRSNDVCNVKAYHQIWPVEYADYRKDFWYLSPFDLITDTGESLIDPLPRRRARL